MANPPVVHGIAPSPKSELAFDQLHVASPDDITLANRYFLGDGITVITNRDRENPETNLAVTLIDEGPDVGDNSARIVRLNVGQTVVSARATSPYHIYEIFQPTSVLGEIAVALGKAEPMTGEYAGDHMRARQVSLAAQMIEDVDVQPIRALIIKLTQP